MTTDDDTAPEAPELVTATVTCRTDECANAGVAIELQIAAENPYVVCGVCGQQITDVTPS